MLIFSLILLQVFIFVGLLLMLRRILTQNVVSATKHLEDMNQEYIKKEIEIKQKLEEANQQATQMAGKAREEAEKTRAQTIKAAEEERDRIIKQARVQNDEIIQQAEKSRQVLLSEIEARIYKEAVNRACDLIQRTLPEDLKRRIHSHWVEELMKGSLNEVGNIHLTPDIAEIRIVSAFSLTPEDRKALLKKLKDVSSRDIALKEETDEALVAGFVINIGSTVLDGSLRNKIKEQTKGTSVS